MNAGVGSDVGNINVAASVGGANSGVAGGVAVLTGGVSGGLSVLDSVLIVVSVSAGGMAGVVSNLAISGAIVAI